MESLLLSLILISPFVAAWGILLFFFRNRQIAPIFSVVLMGVSAVSTLILLFTHLHSAPIEISSVWLDLGDRQVIMGFYLDPLSLLMLAIVGVISFLAQLYSLGYMKDDEDRPRYFAWMSLFSWSMLFFVAASNILQALIFWELVGLFSYLLIGFWYHKSSAAAAAKKAFYLTRLGDIGFFIGVLLLLSWLGNISFAQLNAEAVLANHSPTALFIVCLLIFCGVAGKSAQFPLHSWLPDAMEGPTPVSSLIHSATMVAAGVYLLARAFPLFSGSPEAMHLFLFIATITTLIAAFLGLIEKDIKRIMAYSTVSQLGMMVMAIAAGSMQAGMFHLLTHAFFKSMLFLVAGILIHSLGTNDIFELASKGARKHKVAWLGLIVGCFALSGLFPFSGFFSKEAIYDALLHGPHPIYFYFALFGSFLTAVYSFRLIFVLAFPKEEQNAHRHEEKVMNLPVLFLAATTLVLGFFGGKIMHFLGAGAHHSEGMEKIIAMSVTGLIAGALISYLNFGVKNKRGATLGLFDKVPVLTTVIQNKFYVDHVIYFLFRQGYMGLSKVLHWIDLNVINALVNLVGRSVIELGRWTTKIQAGLVQVYLGIGFIGIALVVVFYLL